MCLTETEIVHGAGTSRTCVSFNEKRHSSAPLRLLINFVESYGEAFLKSSFSRNSILLVFVQSTVA